MRKADSVRKSAKKIPIVSQFLHALRNFHLSLKLKNWNIKIWKDSWYPDVVYYVVNYVGIFNRGRRRRTKPRFDVHTAKKNTNVTDRILPF